MSPAQAYAARPQQRPRVRSYHIFLLALLVRLALLLASHGLVFTETRVTDQVSFQNEATNVAASIANGNGYESPFIGALGGNPHLGPTSWLAPVYPLFIALWFWIFDVFSRQAYFCIIAAQCVFSAVTAIPILRIGELTVGRRAGMIASFTWAVFPWFSRWAITWIWEISLSTLLLTLLFWFTLALKEETTRRAWIRFGALWGFTLLVNPALLTFLPVSLAWVALERRRRPLGWITPTLLTLLAATAVISPWLIRNRIVFGQWAFLRTNFGFEFVMGNVHGGTGRDWAMRSPTTNPEELAKYRRLGELGYVRSKSEEGRAFLRNHPDEFLRFTRGRFATYWNGSSMFYDSPVAWFWAPWSFLPLSILLVPGLLFAVIRRVRGWPLYLGLILVYPLPYYITFAQARYRNALEPFLLLLIASMLVRLFAPNSDAHLARTGIR